MSSVAQPLPYSLERIVRRFQQISEPRRRYEYLLCFAKRLPPFPDDQKTAVHRVLGCVSQVYVTVGLEHGVLRQWGRASDDKALSGF
jgi:cysteine desulfuration protein SufE